MHDGPWCVFSVQKSSVSEAAEEPLSLLNYRNCNNKNREEKKRKEMGLSELRKENTVLKLF